MQKVYVIATLSSLTILASCANRTNYCDPCYIGPCTEVVNKEYVHKYGVPIPEGHWQKCGETGNVVTTLSNGVVCRQTYQGGVLDGETTYTFPYSSDIERRQHYAHDVLAEDIYYWRNGNTKQQKSYQSPDKRIVQEWYENGNQKSLERYSDELLMHGEYYDKNQRLDSKVLDGKDTRINRDRYGQLLSSHNFQNGVIDSETTFHPNGIPKAITPYKSGYIHGERKTYLPGGEPDSIENWVEGKQHGMTTQFKDGERIAEIPYENGRRSGKGRIFRDGMVVSQEVTWKDDQMHGPCVHYNGELNYTEYFWKGKKVSKGYWDQMSHPPGGI